MVRNLFVGEKKRKEIVKTILITVLIGVFTQVVASFLLTIILDSFFPSAAKDYGESVGAIQFTPFIVIFTCIVAPILEELVFRLALLGILKRFIPFMVANIIQAIAFGIYHGNIVQGIYASILGMFIGYLYYLTGGVLYTISFHAGINFMGLFIDRLIPSSTPLLVCGLLCLLSLVIIYALMLVLKRK